MTQRDLTRATSRFYVTEVPIHIRDDEVLKAARSAGFCGLEHENGYDQLIPESLHVRDKVFDNLPKITWEEIIHRHPVAIAQV
jgi:hypothetical protein